MKKCFMMAGSIALTVGLIFSGALLAPAQAKPAVNSKGADLVVIGGGGAGMTAALTATQNGVKHVIVLEKQPYIGGNSALAGGDIFAVGSPQQKAAGITTTIDEKFKETMAFHHYDWADSRIVRVWFERSSETIQWLISNGAPFIWGERSFVLANATGPTGNFGNVIKMLASKFEEKGGEILLNTTAKKILRNPQGKITGVLAVDGQGKEILIKANAVVLASGGFTGSQTLLGKYFPGDEHIFTEATLDNLGDGIQLAGSAGAALQNYATLIRENGFSFSTGDNMPNRIGMSASLWVNRRGMRFADESMEGNETSNPLKIQPSQMGFALFDDDMIQNVGKDSAQFLTTKPGEKQRSLKELFLAYVQKEKSDAGPKGTVTADKSWVMVSDNWDEIAAWMGADPKTLKDTVEEFNSFCDKGHDDLFGKDKKYLVPLRKGPFYAVRYRALMVDTIGPVRVDEHMQVLNKQGNIIPGLYAAGVITAGWEGHDYHNFGSALSFTVTSGRIAAESSAKYLASK
jgi:fumarate reductase flavoprotein subunit